MALVYDNARVAVIGAGVSGLSFAYFLSRIAPKTRITLYDAAARPGGYINSQEHEVDDVPVILEKGPRTLRGASDGTVLIADTLIQLGQADKIKVIPSNSISNKKYLLSPFDDLIQVPNSISTLKNFLTSPLGKGLLPGLVKEPFQPKGGRKDESVASFLNRRFGPSLAQNVISAVFHGVYAADINKLSAKTTLKSMFDAEKKHGSVVKSMFSKMSPNGLTPPALSKTLQDYEYRFPHDYELTNLSKILKEFPMITLQGGLETFPNTLYESLLTNPNVEFKFKTPVETIKLEEGNVTDEIIINDEPYNHVHSTINANALARTMPNTTSGSIASQLEYIDIHMINIYVPSHIMEYTGFGYLVPQVHKNPLGILGVIFDSDVEKGSVQLLSSLDVLNSDEAPDVSPVYRDEDYTKLTIMMGGHYWSERGPPQDLEETTREALREVEKHLEVRFDETCYIDDTYIKQCLPQFHVGYEKLKKKFTKSVEREFGGQLTFGGMSFGDGAGVPDCVSNAYKTAVKLGDYEGLVYNDDE